MRAFRVAYGVQDDLHEYARAWLATGSPLAGATALRDIGNGQFAVLGRGGRFQVELCVVRGGVEIPEHTHPHADTIEVGIAGAVRLLVNRADPFEAIPDERLAIFTKGRGIRINRGDRHGGRVLSGGAMFLSVQRWDGVPGSVLTDYLGQRDPAADWSALP